MDVITSRDNPLVKKIVRLHDAKHRKQEGLFIAEGLRTCMTLLEASMHCTHLLYTQEAETQIATLDNVDNHILVSQSVMAKISAATTPSGIVGIFTIPYPQKSSSLTSPGLVLANIQDPGNMGTLIRTAAAINAHTVVIIEGCDPWNPKVIQASAGTIGMVNIIQWSWEELRHNKGTVPLYALVVHNGKSLHEVNMRNGLLVVGNEAHGIPDEWLKDCTELITLPMPGKTESLNAAVAGSIALYMGYVRT